MLSHSLMLVKRTHWISFKGTEQEKDRMVNIMLGEKQIDQYRTQSEQTMKSNEDTAKYSILTRLILDI